MLDDAFKLTLDVLFPKTRNGKTLKSSRSTFNISIDSIYFLRSIMEIKKRNR